MEDEGNLCLCSFPEEGLEMKNGDAIFKETMVFSTNSVGKTGYSSAKKRSFILYIKINLKWIQI